MALRVLICLPPRREKHDAKKKIIKKINTKIPKILYILPMIFLRSI